MKLKANSHNFPWLFLLFTNCIVWNIIAVSKMGLVSLWGTSVPEDHWFSSVPMKCLWPDQLLLEARSPLSNRTRLFFPISPSGWRGCRCLFWLWPIVTMIYLWALVPSLALAPVQSPAWCCKSFHLMLVCMKGTELQLHLARKAGSRNFSGAIFWAYSGVFFNKHENTLECSANFTDQ